MYHDRQSYMVFDESHNDHDQVYASYFRKRFACDSPYLLRYAFGGPDHVEFLKWEKDAAELGREEMRKRMEEFWNPAQTPAKRQRAECEGQTPSKEPRVDMQRQ